MTINAFLFKLALSLFTVDAVCNTFSFVPVAKLPFSFTDAIDMFGLKPPAVQPNQDFLLEAGSTNI